MQVNLNLHVLDQLENPLVIKDQNGVIQACNLAFFKTRERNCHDHQS